MEELTSQHRCFADFPNECRDSGCQWYYEKSPSLWGMILPAFLGVVPYQGKYPVTAICRRYNKTSPLESH